MDRHAFEDNDETTSRSHHELVVEEIAQLGERERVLIIENDQLRAQLVEMKEQEKKKYDDLMVQYNMKREYEDDGLDYNGTAANQVTVKTESDDEDVKVQIKVEIKEEDDEEDHDTFIKTESNDVKIEIKEEIKEEEDEDDRGGFALRLVKKEEVSDDDEVDNEGGLIRGGDNDEVTQPNVDCGQLWSNPSRDRKNDSNANESIEEGGTNLSSQQLLHTLNEPNEVTTVTQSDGDLFSPSTSTGLGSNRTALNQQATASTGRNANKRKQQTSKRSAKRSKKTIEEDEGEDGEDIVNDDREEVKVKVLHLNCTQSNCNVKLYSLVHLHDHLSTVHRLAPLQCFATDCNARFDNSFQIGDHIQLHHPQDTRFLCAVCPKKYDSQKKANSHWYKKHLTGQFECNFVNDCAKVTDTRGKMKTHLQTAHYSQSKHLHCTHPGCTASFAFNADLKRHELTHLNNQPFHCNWHQCSTRSNRRSNLVKHIRTQHFGLPKSLKEQKEKNIVDERDPNEYVRVVVDE